MQNKEKDFSFTKGAVIISRLKFHYDYYFLLPIF